MNSLQFQPATRQGDSSKHERHYLDFIVSGQSLLEVLAMDHLDLITPFGWLPDKAYEQKLIRVFTFQSRSDIASGRVLLYICPECGDVNCGAITATILDLGDRIIWKDFGYETDYGGLTEVYTLDPIEIVRRDYFDAFSILQ